MPRLPLPDLPVAETLHELRRALSGPGTAVLVAPPGAGKTTLVPLALLDEEWLAGGRIVVLEPRRLATRAAARRMADLLGETVGETVGYQTRDERRIGPSTRIEVVTEGILTRRLQSDPELPGVGLVVFDEVHERNLTTDLGLAFALDARSTLRPDLRLLAMSATPDTSALTAAIPDVQVIESEGRLHPVDVRWFPRERKQRIEDATAAAVRRAVREEPGDVLVFLPGIGEIIRTGDALAGSLPDDVDVFQLAGALPLEQQDHALNPSAPGRRRIVLSTDIAETSLTVEGVRVVVDSGLARAPRFDTRTGMSRLTTISTSRASADQRTGRAGRVEPGVCYRLWSKVEHGSRPKHRAPEIGEVDLAGLALELAAWGNRPGRPGLAHRATPYRNARRRRAAAAARGDRRRRTAHRHRTIDARHARPSAPRTHARERTLVARMRARRPRRRARCPARPARRSAERPRSSPSARRRAGRPTTRPTVARSTRSGAVPRISPVDSGSTGTPTSSIPTVPAWPCCTHSPTGWPAAGGRASSSCEPGRVAGSPTTIPSPTSSSSSRPTSMASATGPASDSQPASTPTRSRWSSMTT